LAGIFLLLFLLLLLVWPEALELREEE